MFQKLDAVEKRYDELTAKISDPEVIANQSEWQKYMKEHASLVDIVEKYREYKLAKSNFEEAKEMLNDKELKELAELEMEELRVKIPKLEEELKILLIPKDPDDDKNIICEIRAGAGGDEAAQEHMTYTLDLAQNLTTGTYKIVIKLYDGEQYIGETFEYMIIK